MVVLLILLLLSVMAPALLLVTTTERQIGNNERRATTTFFTSESGVAVASAWMFEGNHESHSVELSRKEIGSTAIREVVDTSRVLSSGTSYSYLSDVTHYSTGSPQVRHNYRFSNTARRLLGQQVLGSQEVRLMMELDPWDEGAVRDLRDGPPQYAESAAAAEGDEEDAS